MKVRRFELVTGQITAAMGGAILAIGERPLAGIIALLFSYGWATGFFTDMFYEEDEQEGGAVNDRKYEDRRLPVARRKRA
jgi:hypothetical protein